MTVALVVLTLDKKLHEFVREHQTNVIPRDLRVLSNGEPIEASSFLLENINSSEDAKRYVFRAAHRGNGVLVLCDPALRQALADLEDVCFVNSVDVDVNEVNMQNFLGRCLARTIKNYEALRLRLLNAKYTKVLLLPLKNFLARELGEIAHICSHSLTFPRFAPVLAAKLEQFKNRQRPKRASDYRTVYLVDDGSLHFVYGLERHASCETGTPHTYMCEFRRDFRFGVRIDAARHFNVSREATSIAGEQFRDCHFALRAAQRDSHINMFPSGFFT
jgi:hypothetical protein